MSHWCTIFNCFDVLESAERHAGGLTLVFGVGGVIGLFGILGIIAILEKVDAIAFAFRFGRSIILAEASTCLSYLSLHPSGIFHWPLGLPCLISAFSGTFWKLALFLRAWSSPQW